MRSMLKKIVCSVSVLLGALVVAGPDAAGPDVAAGVIPTSVGWCLIFAGLVGWWVSRRKEE